ncbi:MAG: hypothetical protein MJK14_14345 [Rivularia sp. ALOHA_DT_140]|nr:hypothetical protein [Rivularia sp. ALOHA_DT_140]
MFQIGFGTGWCVGAGLGFEPGIAINLGRIIVFIELFYLSNLNNNHLP